MAATLTRKAPGLLRQLIVSARAPKLCRFSTVTRLPTLQRSTPLWASMSARLCQPPQQSLLQRVSPLIPGLAQQPTRSLIYYSVKKAKRKSVESVKARFLRLHCGLWVRRKAGYKKKLWRKMPARKNRLREHVFCNKTQCKLLDKMTTKFWKRRNWYLDDPYFKYHDRVNLNI